MKPLPPSPSLPLASRLRRTGLTIPIQESDAHKLESILKRKLPKVDAFEIWLDHLKKKDQQPEVVEMAVRKWKRMTKKKLVLVCKDSREKGKFKGTDRAKVELLLAAARAGVDYIDLSFQTQKDQLSRLVKGKKKAKLIISWHDFVKTPPLKRLQKISQQIIDLGADVVKIASQVDTVGDNENLMLLALELKQKRQKHIVLGMGTLGITTRVFSSQLGNELNFVALDQQRTAPGQLTLDEFLKFEKVMK